MDRRSQIAVACGKTDIESPWYGKKSRLWAPKHKQSFETANNNQKFRDLLLKNHKFIASLRLQVPDVGGPWEVAIIYQVICLLQQHEMGTLPIDIWIVYNLMEYL